MIIIASKISKKDRWEYLDQKYLKGLVGILRKKKYNKVEFFERIKC